MPGGQRRGEVAGMGCCRDITQKFSSDEFREASLWKRLTVRFHLLMCRNCRRYAAQLRTIGEIARHLWGPHSEDPSTLERLEREILETTRGDHEGGSIDSQ